MIWVCKTPTVSFQERHRDPLRQIHLSRAVPAPFLKALPRFCTLQIFTYCNTFVLIPGISDKWLPGQKQPSGKENTPLEPAGKVLNVRSKKQAGKNGIPPGRAFSHQFRLPTFRVFPAAPEYSIMTIWMRLAFWQSV